ncbi:MAG: hypothetical protein ABII25_01185 [bacterium]
MKKNLRFVIVSLALLVFLGCGKDDKNVTSVTPPSYYTYGASVDSTYLNAIPRDLTVTKGLAPVANNIVWDAPVFTTNLIGYNVVTIAPGKESKGFTSATNFSDTTNVTAGYSYTFYVTSVFSILDSTYSFYSQSESLPSGSAVLDR